MVLSVIFTTIVLFMIMAVGIVTFVFLKQPFGRFVAIAILSMVAFSVIITKLLT